MDKKIVMLVGQTRSSTIMYNEIIKEFNIDCVIQDTPVSMKQILKNRIKRIGYFQVFGQILFGVMLLPIIRFFSKSQTEKVFKALNIDFTPIPESIIIKTNSINSDDCLEKLKEINPDIVIVNGCRIISNKILKNIDAVFINTHEGITPKYRGIHGGYWALVNDDRENCGVTVHLVDKGVDTGGVLYQSKIHPTKNDNFTTYPLYQTIEGSKILKNAIQDVCNNDIKVIKGVGESHIWYHPTIWEYLYYRIVKNVK